MSDNQKMIPQKLRDSIEAAAKKGIHRRPTFVVAADCVHYTPDENIKAEKGTCDIGEFGGTPTIENCVHCVKRESSLLKRFNRGDFQMMSLPKQGLPTPATPSPAVTDELVDTTKWSKAKDIVLRCFQSPGDNLLLMGAVREVWKAFRLGNGSPAFRITPHVHFMQLWNHNPCIIFNRGDLTDPVEIETGWAAQWSHERSDHLVQEWTRSLVGMINGTLNLRLPVPPMTDFRGAVWMSDEEKARGSADIVGDDEPYWIIDAGSKDDYTTKRWPAQFYQAVVDGLQGKVRFVQMGRHTANDIHHSLHGVVNCIGRTETDNGGEDGLRKLLRLFYRSSGVVTPISFPLHAAAAVPMPNDMYRRPCVCIAGGKEPQNFIQYPGHTVFSTVGMLDCCAHQACWLDHTEDREKFTKGVSQRRCLNHDRGIPACMRMITPDMVIAAVERYLVKPKAKPKICMVTMADYRMAELRDLSFVNKQEYCERHGYDFIGETESFHEWEESDGKRRYLDDRPASWSKLPIILKLMSEYDWIFWSDADSVVTNPDVRLEDFIDNDYEFIIADDQNGRNCGQFMVKKTLRMWGFLREAWDRRHHIHSGVWEQGAIGELLSENPLRIREKKVPQRWFNSYPSNYQKGDFILHCPRDDRWRDRVGTLKKALSGEAVLI